MHPAWARSIRDQCIAADIPFFFKQWGEWLPLAEAYPRAADGGVYVDGRRRFTLRVADHEGVLYARMGKRAAGRSFDGRVWSEFPR